MNGRSCPRRPWFTGGLCLTLVIAACGRDQPTSGTLAAPSVPTPRLAIEVSSCPDRLPSAVRAHRSTRRAQMRIERYPYDPGDGVRGALLLLEASRCFDEAGHQAESARAASSARRLVERLQSDYAVAHVTLERALLEQNWDEALRQSRRLLAFSEHTRADAYTRWVESVVSRVSSYAGTTS